MYKNHLVNNRKNKISLGLVYPNRLKIMLSSYTIRFLFHYLNDKLEVFCDRFSLPEKYTFPAYRDAQPLNNLRSFDHNLNAREFDILGFSIHYENDYRNTLWFLDKVGIPLKFEERHKARNQGMSPPILIAGGPVITSNPLPFSNIFDACFIGDSENNLPIFLDHFNQFIYQNINLEKFLNSLKEVKGIYIPSLKNEVSREVLSNLDKSPIPYNQISQKIGEGQFENNFFLEVNRGCPYKCKFCLSSYHNSPFRNRSYQNIIDCIENSLVKSQFDKISLIGSCASSHPQFSKICNYILEKGKNFSIPSIRLEHITPEIIKICEKAGIKTITIAPETGGDLLRSQVGKVFSNNDIIKKATLIRNSSIRNIKLYFLIGLPGESDKDISEFVNLIKKIGELDFPNNSLRVNINPFIPKLNTPYEFQTTYFIRDKLKILKSRLNSLIESLKNLQYVKLKIQKPKEIVNQARLQTLISVGDEEIAKLLLEYYRLGANLGSLRRAEKNLNISIDDYLSKINSGFKPWKY
jgi:radical SAM superfamily enzyme YgiQ (UPF0313 family)